MDHCSFSDSTVLKNLQIQGGLNPEYWKKTLRRLGKNYSEYRLDREGCPEIKIKFENEYWLPTSKQLKDLYWLGFEGSVCADDFSKCSKTIDQIWPKGKRLIVGNDVYVSKGHSAK